MPALCGEGQADTGGNYKGRRKKLMDYKEIKVLHTEAEVNQYLEKGWKLIKVFAADSYVLGFSKATD